jgi:hypothetical protein
MKTEESNIKSEVPVIEFTVEPLPAAAPTPVYKQIFQNKELIVILLLSVGL